MVKKMKNFLASLEELSIFNPVIYPEFQEVANYKDALEYISQIQYCDTF